MKICHIAPAGWQQDLEPELEKLGHTVVEFPDPHVDVIIVKSITQMGRSSSASKFYPDVPVIEYHWDLYSWALNTPRRGEYDYNRYKELCERAIEVWVPSNAAKYSLQDFWDMDSHVMTSWCPQYPIPQDVLIKDGGYALQAVRQNPDKKIGWFESACKETGIDWKLTWAKELSEPDYRKLLSHSKFLCSALHEMSTGGQFLSEGAAIGKPILSAKGRHHGAVDYFGDTIEYFDGDNFEELCDKLKKFSTGELTSNTEAAKERILSMTTEWFAKKVDKRLKEIL